MCHGAPKASLKTHRMRRGGSRARRRALSPGLLLLSDRHVECWMHNNLLSHLRIHCPHPRTLFLASFLLSLRALAAPVRRPSARTFPTGSQRGSLLSERERIGARAIAPGKRITTASASQVAKIGESGRVHSQYEEKVMVHSRGMKCFTTAYWPIR